MRESSSGSLFEKSANPPLNRRSLSMPMIRSKSWSVMRRAGRGSTCRFTGQNAHVLLHRLMVSISTRSNSAPRAVTSAMISSIIRRARTTLRRVRRRSNAS